MKNEGLEETWLERSQNGLETVAASGSPPLTALPAWGPSGERTMLLQGREIQSGGETAL